MAISQSTRIRVLDQAEWQCQYCGKLMQDKGSRYSPDYPCCNLFVSRRYGGTDKYTNLVSSCRGCAAIKSDLDVREMSIEAIRKFINQRRKARHMEYNPEFANASVAVPDDEEVVILMPPLKHDLVRDKVEDKGVLSSPGLVPLAGDSASFPANADLDDDSDIDPALAQLPPDFFSKPSTLVRGELRPLHPEAQDDVKPTPSPKPPTTNPLSE